MRLKKARRSGWRSPASGCILVLALALLASCAGTDATTARPTPAPPTATTAANPRVLAEQTATAAAFATANAKQLAAMLTPAAATPTAIPVPTGTSTPIPHISPTIVAMPSPSASSEGSLATWPVGNVSGQYPAKTTYDAASGAYTISLTDAMQFYAFPVYQPGKSAFAGVRIAVDIHQAAGPNDAAYGVVCGVQGTSDQRTGYNVLLYPDTQQFSISWHPSQGRGTVIVPITGAPALKEHGVVNRLQVTCQGNKITIAINDVVAGTYPVTQPTMGTIGLIVVAPPHPSGPTGTSATFAHLLVTPLS